MKNFTSKTITNFKLFEVGVSFGYYYDRILDYVGYGPGSIKASFPIGVPESYPGVHF